MSKLLTAEKKREAARPGATIKPTRRIALYALVVVLSITSIGVVLMAAGIGTPAAGWKGIRSSAQQAAPVNPS